MIIRRLGFAIALAAFIFAAAALLPLAEQAGYLEPDGARRTMQVIIGLVLAAYANLMPKQLSQSLRSPVAEARAQAALRVGGWSLTIAGLVHAGLWAFAPLPAADMVATLAVAAALIVTVGYAARACAGCRNRNELGLRR